MDFCKYSAGGRWRAVGGVLNPGGSSVERMHACFLAVCFGKESMYSFLIFTKSSPILYA
jgi:hypothetical protein